MLLMALHISLNMTRANKVQQVEDPRAPQIQGGAGPVADGSLAAESTRSGGQFSQNRNAEQDGLPGGSTAERLRPAPDAEARMAKDEWTEERRHGNNATSYPDGLGGQDKSLGYENTKMGYDPSAMGTKVDVDNAPTYVNSQYFDAGKPKGKNITEGDFDSYPGKNASFNQEIGTRKDPGRLAERKFQRDNADSAYDAAMPRQKGLSNDNDYNVLDS